MEIGFERNNIYDKKSFSDTEGVKDNNGYPYSYYPHIPAILINRSHIQPMLKEAKDLFDKHILELDKKCTDPSFFK